MALAFLLGIMAVTPIGGADMPVVISLLNSYSGLAACAAGFVIFNNILIVAGALVGASGLILTNIMCKAMNRSLTNVLFSGFGAVAGKTRKPTGGDPRPISAEDAYFILEAARSVVFVPGYGLAVAQAPARGDGAGGAPGRQWLRSPLCRPSGRRPDAGTYERAAGGGPTCPTTCWSRSTTSIPPWRPWTCAW